MGMSTDFCHVSALLSDRLLLALRASVKFVVRIARSIPQVSQYIHGPTGGSNTARSKLTMRRVTEGCQFLRLGFSYNGYLVFARIDSGSG